jgi:two-component system, sporulation sensor kinase E
MVDQFRTALDELGRVEQIIADFLSIAKNKIEYKQQNLNTIIRKIIPLISTEAIKQGITLEANLTDDIPDLLLDEGEIKQLILNFAKNAIEAMDKVGTLTIETVNNL